MAMKHRGNLPKPIRKTVLYALLVAVRSPLDNSSFKPLHIYKFGSLLILMPPFSPPSIKRRPELGFFVPRPLKAVMRANTFWTLTFLWSLPFNKCSMIQQFLFQNHPTWWVVSRAFRGIAEDCAAVPHPLSPRSCILRKILKTASISSFFLKLTTRTKMISQMS